MKVKLTGTNLDTGVRVYAIGQTAEAGEDVSAEALASLVERGLAVEIRVDGGISSELEAAIAAYRASFAPLRVAFIRMVDLAEAEGMAGATALVEVLTQSAPEAFVRDLDDRVGNLFRLERESRGQPLFDTQSLAEESPVASAGGDPGGMDPGSEGGDARDASPPENKGAEGATADAPQPEAGQRGDAEAPTSAEPGDGEASASPVAATLAEAKKPARKGSSRAAD